MRTIINTPIKNDDIINLKAGDIIYLSGFVVTCRDIAHHRLVKQKEKIPLDLNGLAIFHAGPIIKQEKDKYSIVSIGPTTSMRMEKFEEEFIAQTGVKIIIGKGKMGAQTAKDCKELKALHCVFPGGCAVLAASMVKEVIAVEWQNLGMPEALWTLKVEKFGPLIISIDTNGNNIFDDNLELYNSNKNKVLKELYTKVQFMK